MPLNWLIPLRNLCTNSIPTHKNRT